jgi:SanA protein
MKVVNKIIRSLIVIALAIIIGIWTINSYIYHTTTSKIYNDIDLLPYANTVIVLGASVHSNGKLSPVLKDRVDTALRLYEKGKVKRFLLSGDHRVDDYNEVKAMKNYLLCLNVPEAHIITDPGGLDTYDSMSRSQEFIDTKHAIVVTQEFHLPRAIFIAKNLGLNYFGYPANSEAFDSEISLHRREKLANLKAVYELLLKKTSHNYEAVNPLNDQSQITAGK